MIRHPRILFYAVNGLGLGHVTRLLAIAAEVRKLSPGAEILFFTTSEAEDVIFKEGFAAFKAPSKSIRQTAALRPATYSRLLQTVTLNLVSSFHPHILVVDTFPAGALQELLPCLRWDSRKVFVYREQRAEASLSPTNQHALNLYQLAIIPHSPGEAEIITPEGLDTVWTGPIIIRSKDQALPRREARDLLGLPQDLPTLYITFGGGGDRASLAAVCDSVDALRDVQIDNKPLQLAISWAPLQKERPPRGANIHVVEHYPMAELYPAFDAALTACGYNTMMEMLHHGLPMAMVPFHRQVDDQHARADWVEGHGAGIHLRDRTPEALVKAVRQLFDPIQSMQMSDAGPKLVLGDGAHCAAKAIVDLLN